MSDKKVIKTEEEWKAELSEEQYRITREKGTEQPFSGKYDKHFEDGKYLCVACGQELFNSKNKYNSGCGWPAFDAPSTEAKIDEHHDDSHGMIRTEVTCSRCNAHLGHVFPDGPPETTGQRYCINSTSLKFKKEKD